MTFTSYFPSSLFSQKRRKEAEAPQAHADEIHMSPEMIPTGIIRAERPGWAACNHMIACLIVSLQKAGCKTIILDKLQLVQLKD